ncbi:MAG: DUF2974 domain-containing protein [Coriobacteriales bacterium]|nr:DUF2974 domain-containing protein [Coriobacteriales bacterium]
MATIKDYLCWRGDLTFDERPFNDVDNLVLSTLSYLDFTGIVPTEEQGDCVDLAAACNKLLKRANGNIEPYVRSLAKVDEEFVRLVAQSRRFASSVACAYADVIDESKALQFSAMQFDLPDAGSYIAFRGTDLSIVGWRENFMLCFTITEAQQEAARYLQRAIGRIPDGTSIWVGGHSKGGNLAEYAIIKCPPELRGRVACTYSNDGPGFSSDVLGEMEREAAHELVRHIVPTYSIVGMLYYSSADKRVVVSSGATGIEQHDITTWRITPTGLDEAADLLPECMVLNEAIASWVEEVPLNEREGIVDQVFDAFEAGGATTFDEIASTPEGLQHVVRALAATDERTHEVAYALTQMALGSSVEAVRIAAHRLINDMGKRLFAHSKVRARLGR